MPVYIDTTDISVQMVMVNTEYSIFVCFHTILLHLTCNRYCNKVQSNGSNTDGSFTTAYSNSFLNPYEILPIAQENKCLGKFSYLSTKLYFVCTH